MKRICLMFILLMIMFSSLSAEDLPTKGIFKGIYHKDRFGIGRFKFFLIVDKTLQNRLEEYDGKYIEMEVLEGRQPMNPGPAFVDKIGYIKLLPQPFTIKIKDQKITVQENTRFQIPCLLRNEGKTTIKTGSVSISTQIRECGEFKELQKKRYGSISSLRFWGISRKEGTNPAIGTSHIQCFGLIGRDSFTFCDFLGSEGSYMRYLLKPGSFMPFALAFDKGLPAGKYDIEVCVNEIPTTVKSWMEIDSVKKEIEQKAIPSELSLSYSQIKKDDPWIKPTYWGIDEVMRKEWIGLALTLRNKSQKERFMPVGKDSGGMLWIGHLLGHTASGKTLNLVFKYRHPPDEPWHLVKIPEKGHTIKFHFRQPSYFPEEPIVKLTCEILTDQGLESFVIEPEYQDSYFVKSPEPGPAANGVTCRIRTDKNTYNVGETVRFYVQFTNVDNKPVCWWSPYSGLGENREVLIDGKNITLSKNKADGISGWACQRLCSIPEESSICLPDSLSLSPGKHSLVYKIISKDGVYKNVSGEDIPLLDGVLTSNTVEFTVKKQ